MAAPGGFRAIKKGGGLRPPPLWMILTSDSLKSKYTPRDVRIDTFTRDRVRNKPRAFISSRCMRPDQCVETHCRRLDGELARATTSARVDYIEATSCNPYRLENLMSRDTRGVEGQLLEEDTSRGFLLDTSKPRPPPSLPPEHLYGAGFKRLLG